MEQSSPGFRGIFRTCLLTALSCGSENLDKAGLIQNKTKIAGGLDESVTQPKMVSRRMNFSSCRIVRAGGTCLVGHKKMVLERCALKVSIFASQTGIWAYRRMQSLSGEQDSLYLFRQRNLDDSQYLDLKSSMLTPVDTPFTDFEHVHVSKNYAVFLAASPTEGHCIYRLSLSTRNVREII